jgi:hypothetical protein
MLTTNQKKRQYKVRADQPNLAPAGAIPVVLDADIVTTTSLGVIQVISGLSITPEGTLSATVTDDDYYVGSINKNIIIKENKMSYLFPISSIAEQGVVEIGKNITVENGVISIPQNVATTADVTFNNIEATSDLNVSGLIESTGKITSKADVYGLKLFETLNGSTVQRVITTVTPNGGDGINISSVTSTGPSSSFTVTNTGILEVIAGNGIAVSPKVAGKITISTTGTNNVKTTVITNNYTATDKDEYIGVDSTNLVTVTLPIGVTGRVYTVKEEHGDGTGKVKVQGSNNEKIDGSLFKQLTAYASITVVFRGGSWRVI